MKPQILACAIIAGIAAGAVTSVIAAPGDDRARAVVVSDPLLTSYPNGGPEMSRAVESRLEDACQTAEAVAALFRVANPEQKAAIAVGFARFIKSRTVGSDELNCAREALRNADRTLSAMVSALLSQMYAQNGGNRQGGTGTPFYPGGTSGFSGGGGGGPIIVSPH